MRPNTFTDTSGASDAEVIERSRIDPEMFAVIFDRHADEIYQYAARRLGPDAAPDVVSDVFLAAFRNHNLCEHSYLPNLPKTVHGMRSYLLGLAPNGPAAFRILNGIGSNSWQSGFLVPNSSYALMFRAAAHVKGIHLIRHAVNVAGQQGIAVAACMPAAIGKGSMPGFHGCPQRLELIFAARTYELIGEYDVVTPGSSAVPFLPDYALLQIAVVNKLGELP